MKTLFLVLATLLVLATGVLAAGEGTYGNETYGNFSYGVSSSASASSSESVAVTAAINTTFNATAGANAPNVTIELDTNAAASGTVTVVKYTSQPSSVGTNTFSSPLNRYIDIVVDSSISSILDNATIKMFYTDAEVSAANLQESTLRLSRWNGSAWVKIDSPDGGVDTTNNFVFAKTSQFSTWGLFGTTNPEPAPATSSGGSSSGGGKGAGLTNGPIQLYMREGVEYSIYYLDANNKYTYHTLSIKDVNLVDKTALLIFKSEQKEITINAESYSFMDFDNDFYYDIKAKIMEFVDGKQIKVEIVPIHEEVPSASGGGLGPIEIIKPSEPQVVEEPEIEVEEPETNLTEPTLPVQPEESRKFPTALVISLVIIVLTVLGYYFYQRNKKKKDAKRDSP